MAPLTRELVLTGGRTNYTGLLGKVPFVNGVTTIQGSDREVEALTRYLGRTYKAFPKGSAELKVAQEEDKRHGTGQADQTSQSGTDDAVSSGVQPSGGGSSEVPADVSSGTNDPTSGTEGSVSGGDGHEDSGDDGQSATDQDRVLAAVKSLDPSNDEHWTTDGRPRVDVVAEMAGMPQLTRADIVEVAPDFKRS